VVSSHVTLPTKRHRPSPFATSRCLLDPAPGAFPEGEPRIFSRTYPRTCPLPRPPASRFPPSVTSRRQKPAPLFGVRQIVIPSPRDRHLGFSGEPFFSPFPVPWAGDRQSMCSPFSERMETFLRSYVPPPPLSIESHQFRSPPTVTTGGDRLTPRSPCSGRALLSFSGRLLSTFRFNSVVERSCSPSNSHVINNLFLGTAPFPFSPLW